MTIDPMESWVSADTEAKESDFRGIVAMHLRIAQSVIARQSRLPYLYVDLHAGPGMLEWRGRQFPGSPLVFLDEAARVGARYRSLHFEQDAVTAGRLRMAMERCGASHESIVFAEPFQTGFGDTLAAQPISPTQFGLIYSDPIRDEIPHEVLALAGRKLPKVDFLTYVSATQYKRRRGGDDSRPYLSDHIKAVGKQVVLVRRPMGMWQWTFLLFTNMTRFPEWTKRGFYRLDSPEGRGILRTLDLTDREQKADMCEPLFGLEEL